MSDQPRSGMDRLWGRRQSFALRPRQQALFESLLPGVALTLPPDSAPGTIHPRSFFPPPQAGEVSRGDGVGTTFANTLPPSPASGRTSPACGRGKVSLEIGFGGGEHLIAWAKREPGAAFIGAEPFVNGMGKMLAHLDDEKLENVRLFAGDARRLVEALAPASLARVWLLFPDPWPKKRHWKRRYVQDETLRQFARVLESGGRLRIASDIPHYIEWTLERMARAPTFTAVHDVGGWRNRPADWPPTRYEQKALREARVPVYLEYRRT